MSVEHRIPQCTGRWDPRSSGGKLEWICSQCGAVGEDRMENHLQAVREIMIREQLVEEGRVVARTACIPGMERLSGGLL